MKADQTESLEELRAENELLLLQLKRLETELKKKIDPVEGESMLSHREISARDVEISAEDSVILEFGGNWHLVRKLLDSEKGAVNELLMPLSAKYFVSSYRNLLARSAGLDGVSTEFQEELKTTGVQTIDKLQALAAEAARFEDLVSKSFTNLYEELDKLSGECVRVSDRAVHRTNQALAEQLEALEERITHGFDQRLRQSEETVVQVLNRSSDNQSAVLDEMLQRAGLTAGRSIELQDLDKLFERQQGRLGEMIDSLHEKSSASLAAAQDHSEALRGDLTLALKMQLVRDNDYKELQDRFRAQRVEKLDQESVLLELRDKLTAASNFLRELRDNNASSSIDGVEQNLASLLSVDSDPDA